MTHRDDVLAQLRANTGGRVQDEMLLHIASLVMHIVSSDLYEVGHENAADTVTRLREHIDNTPLGPVVRPQV